MNEEMKLHVAEMVGTLSEAWKCSLITAGLNSGIFAALDKENPVSIGALASKLNFDEEKLDKWFYYCQNCGLVQKVDGGYIISPKSSVFMPDSPVKDIVGFVRLNDFFMRAAVDAPEYFRKESSLDKLTEGKITRNYQPTVSDNLSAELIGYFKRHEMSPGDTLLDVGCGIGAFDRAIVKEMPGIKLTGMDSNLFAIEWGRKENKQKGLSENLKLIVGDAREDMKDFKDGAFDWVMAINVFHFFPVKLRAALIDEMIRTSKRGVFFTEIIVEKTKISFAADPLMSLLWNDFTGFFREADAEKLNTSIQQKYSGFKMIKYPILQGSSYLIAVLK